MTTYSAISNALLAIGAAARSSTVTALRDNPIAISEGSTSAPVLSAGWHPFDMVTVGDGNDGNIYAGTTVATVESDPFVDGYEYMFIFDAIGHDNVSVGRQLTVELYLETDAVYDTAIAFLSALAPAADTTGQGDGILYCRAPRSVLRSHHLQYQFGRGDGAQMNNVLPNDLAAQYDATAQPISKVRFGWNNTANFNEGNIYQYRRREFITG